MCALRVVLGLLAMGALLAGCRGEATQTIIRLEAAPTLEARAAELRVEVRDADGSVRLDRVVARASGELTFPTEIGVSPDEGDPNRAYEVRATLVDEASVRLGQIHVRVSGFVPGQRTELVLRFDAECEAVRCADSETCVAGGCASGTLAPGEPLEPGEDIRRFCDQGWCFEHPLPLGDRYLAACLTGPGTGYVLARERLVRVDGGLVDVLPLPEPATDLTCAPTGEAYVLSEEALDVYVGRELQWSVAATGRVIHRTASGAIWLAGNEGVARLEGDSFQLVGAPDEDPRFGEVRAFASDGETVYAGGAGLHRFDGAWAHLSDLDEEGAPTLLTSLAVQGRRVYAATGDFGTLHVWEDGTWADLGRGCLRVRPFRDGVVCSRSGAPAVFEPDGTYRELEIDPAASDFTNRSFLALAVAGDALLMASTFGHILVGDAESPLTSPLNRASDAPITAVARSGVRTVAVTSTGAVLERQDSATWSRARTLWSHDPVALRAVALGPADGTAPSGVAVGLAGALLELREDRWLEVESPTTEPLRAAAWTPDGFVCGGDDGHLFRRSADGAWEPFATGRLGAPVQTLTWADGLFASLADGSLWRFEGDEGELWQSFEAPVTAAGPSGGRLFVATAAGVCEFAEGSRSCTPRISLGSAMALLTNEIGLVAVATESQVFLYRGDLPESERLEPTGIPAELLCSTPDGDLLALRANWILRHGL